MRVYSFKKGGPTVLHLDLYERDTVSTEFNRRFQGNPLLSGTDPLISQAGAHPSPHLAGSQMSPDIQWDQSGFSPDAHGHNGMHQQHMDYS